ncbi:MAG: hypothetical protein ACM3ML_37070 [Micromonosporaceae bacterium]
MAQPFGIVLVFSVTPMRSAQGSGRRPQIPGHWAVVPEAEDVAMPLRNRVTPTGEIVADPSRGLMMGNRGFLHGEGRDLGVSRWRSKAWICCVLEWKDVRRDPMPPGRWTALFFLDEATALAAGHRPCAYGRRGRSSPPSPPVTSRSCTRARSPAWHGQRRRDRRPACALT